MELLHVPYKRRDDVERKLWELLAANVLILALIILAGIVSGWGEALAWLGGLLAMDVLHREPMGATCGGNGRWRDGGAARPGGREHLTNLAGCGIILFNYVETKHSS